MKKTLIGASLVLALLPAMALAQRDVVSIGMQQEPTGLDPTQDATAAIEAILSHNVIESLTSLDSKGQVMPGLAESWTVSPDGTRYVFRLIGNAAFHNGRPLAAEDVKFSFERAMAADSTNPEKARFQKIAEVKAPDPRSVEITLKKPDNLFLFYLSSGKAAVFPKEALADFKTKPMGSGPYRFERWTKGESIVLVRNDAHRDAAKARMRQVTFRFIQDPNAAVAALLSGSLDAFPTVPAPETLAQFKTDIRFKVESGSTEGEVILALNNGKAPFNDIRVRRAIAHAIDRKSIIDGAMFGYGTPIGSHFPPHNPYYVDLTGRYPHDIAKSKALLAEAGHPGGFDASIKLPPFPYARRSGEIIAAQLAAVGIRLKIEAVEWAQWIGPVFREGQYDMTVIAHVSPWDIDNYAKGPSYYYRYHNPQFDALLERITASIDPATTKALYQDAQRFIAEESVHAFLFQLANAGVYRAGLAGYWVDVPAPYQPLIGWRWTN